MPAAIAIPLIISAASTAAQVGTQVYAAKKAAKQQKESGDQALGLQRDVLRQQQQNQQPYMTVGQMSLNRMNSMLSRPGDPNIPMVGPGGKPQGDIMVIAPTGQQMMRPASEADHWRSRGATVQDGSMAKPGGMPGMGGGVPRRGPQEMTPATAPWMQTGVR